MGTNDLIEENVRNYDLSTLPNGAEMPLEEEILSLYDSYQTIYKGHLSGTSKLFLIIP